MYRARLLGSVLILVSAVAFGTGGTVSRLALDQGLGTLAWVTWRAVFGGIIVGGILVWAVATGRNRMPPRGMVSRADHLVLLGVAFGSMLVNLLMFTAFSRTTIALAMICFYSYPLLVTLGAVRIFGETIDRTRAAALVMGSVGLFLVLAPSLVGGGVVVDPIGIALALIASAIQATCLLGVGRGFGPVPTVYPATVLLAFSGVSYVIIALVVGQFGAVVSQAVAPAVIPYLVFGTLVGAVMPTLANLAGVRRVGAGRAAILMMLEAVVGVTLAVLFLGEHPSIWQGIGGAAVLAAGALLQMPRADERLVIEAAKLRPETVSGTFGTRPTALRMPILKILAPAPGHMEVSSTLQQTRSDARPQSGLPGSRLGHPIPAGDEGAAQGDAAARRQAGDPVRGRGGGRRRHRAGHHRHEQPEAGHRGPLRHLLRAGAPARGRRATSRCCAGPADRRPGADQLRPPEGAARPRARRADGQGAGRPRAVRGDPVGRCREVGAAVHRRSSSMRTGDPLVGGGGHGGPPTRTLPATVSSTRSRRRDSGDPRLYKVRGAWSRSRTRHAPPATWRSSAGTSSRRRSSRSSSRHRAAPAARSSSPMRSRR